MLCARCQYDLRGHAEDQRCPECGLPVEQTIMLLRRDGKSPTAIGAFILLSLLGGCAVWFFTFVASWSDSIRDVVLAVAVLGILPATVTGIIGRHVLGPRISRLVATPFAWPMAGWGLGCMFAAFEEGWNLMLWTGLGAALFAAALLGTLLADWMRRCATSL